MTDDAPLTFRDFAAAIMNADLSQAAIVLAKLTGLDPTVAAPAAEHFAGKMKSDPSFMMTAMSMRTAVTSGDRAELERVIEACFGLGPERTAEVAKTVAEKFGT